jgi:GrpB-like predicted nucleotidyltransferase (UPF0157 family)
MSPGEPVAGGRGVAVVPYDPAWAERYEVERARIVVALGPTALRVAHVGSTSVVGLEAKPVIDILISVESIRDESAFRPALESLGYERREDVALPDDAYFTLNEDGVRVLQLHVCEAGGTFEREHLAFRDRLRSDAELCDQYAVLKRELAEQYPDDRLAYTAAKAPFIRAALDGEG